MAGSRTLVLLLGAFTLSACSPYVYSQEIAGFGSGVDAVVASYRSGQQAVDAIAVQQRQAAEAAARTRLRLLPGCDQTDPSGTPPRLPDCAVVAFGATTVAAPAALQRNLADAAPAFDALQAYAAALTAVTAAPDGTALNQATQSLITVAGGMAGSIAKLKRKVPPDAPLIAPVGDLIGQAITLLLDQQRLAALRSTVPVVDPYVQVLGQTVRAALADIRAQQVLQLGSALRGDAEPLEVPAVARLSVADYQSKLAVLQARVAAFNQARTADPTATIDAMVNAHHQLALALHANTGQGAAVLRSVQAFVSAAETLKVAIGVPAAAPARSPTPPANKTARN